MPTVAEMELLERSLGGLADTLQRNRALSAAERERRAREALEREELGLRREDLGERRAERAEVRSDRRLGLEAQMKHQERLEALTKEENADRRAKLGLDFLSDLNKTGQLTDEGIKAMEAKFGEMLGRAGIGVSLFRRAVPPEPTSRTTPGGREVTWMPGGRELHVGDTRPVVTEEEDPLTGEVKRKTTRRVDPKELDRAIEELAGRDEAAGPTPQQQREMEEILSRPGIPAHGPPAGAAPAAAAPTFNTEAEARAAGHKTGDVVRLVLNGKATLVRLK